MAILFGDEGANVNHVGSPFEKIESFRAGVLGRHRRLRQPLRRLADRHQSSADHAPSTGVDAWSTSWSSARRGAARVVVGAGVVATGGLVVAGADVVVGATVVVVVVVVDVEVVVRDRSTQSQIIWRSLAVCCSGSFLPSQM